MTRTIMHVDMDAFFASVEQHDHPEYRGKPVVVGSPPDRRGVVSAASYEARVFGIRSAMPSREAGRRCPQAIFLPVNGRRYAEVSAQIFVILERFTPFVEPVSVDEAFLDVTGTVARFGGAVELGRKIKGTIRAETGLTASVGIASNKFLAKLASDLEKPDGLTVVPEGRDAVAAFLAPLPVSRIWGVGKVTAAELEGRGLRTIGDIQRLGAAELAALVGRSRSAHLQALAWGDDDREVETEHGEKSISREHTFSEDVTDAQRIEDTLLELVDDVGRQVREGGKLAGVAHLKLRWKDFSTITRQQRFAHPCSDILSFRETALELYRRETLVKPVRLVGFGVSGFDSRPAEQLGLFEGPPVDRARRDRLSRAVDEIERRFGPGAIGRRTRSRPDD